MTKQVCDVMNTYYIDVAAHIAETEYAKGHWSSWY